MSLWWVPMALSMAGSVVQKQGQTSQNKTARAWNQYNTQMQYNTDLGNIQAQTAIAGVNAAMQLQAGKINAALEMEAGMLNAASARRIAAYNAQLTTATALYNDSLYEQELGLLWESMDLDLLLMSNQRAVERGAIVADQGASGTVIGEGSNADVVVSQMTQESLDATVIRHQADREAKKISDARAQSMWQAQNEFAQTLWMGEMEAYTTLENARIRSTGAMANAQIGAAATLLTASMSAKAGKQSAANMYNAGMWGAQVDYNQNQSTINNNFVKSMFGAGASGIQSYYQFKPTSSPSYTPTFSGGSTSRVRDLVRPPTLNDPGGSLIGSSGR